MSKCLIILVRNTFYTGGSYVNRATYCSSITSKELSHLKLNHTEGHTCFHIKDCAACENIVKKTVLKSSDIYVNKFTGFFTCCRCKRSGKWDLFKRIMSLSKAKNVKKELLSLKENCDRYNTSIDDWGDITRNCEPINKLDEAEILSILSTFNLANCSKENVGKLNIHINKERTHLYFPLHSISSPVVGYKSLDKSGKVETIPDRHCEGFLLLIKRKNAQVVIVNNLFDFFALLNVYNGNLCCVPHENLNLPQSALPALESYSKLVIWLKSDTQSWGATKTLAHKLGYKRCFVVRPTGTLSSPSMAIAENENISKMLNQAQPMWNDSVITYKSLMQEVLSEIENQDEVSGVKWKRFPILNKILKGHRRGEVTVLTGPTGCGKTTFISEYSLDLAMQGVNTLWGSFEIKNSRLVRTMLQQYARAPLEQNLPLFETWSNQFEQLPIFFLKFHGQYEINTVMEAVIQCTYINDIAHVIIDNVQFMINVTTDENKFIDKFWKQDLIIQTFRSFATRYNCHVTLVMHPRKENPMEDLTMNSIFGGAKAIQEADNILIIQDKRLTAIGGKKYLQICKNRYAGDLGMMVLDYDKESRGFSSLKKKVLNVN